MNIGKHFDEVRVTAERAFWWAFALEGYGPAELTAAPSGEDERAWQRAKAKAFLAADKAALKEFELRKICAQVEGGPSLTAKNQK